MRCTPAPPWAPQRATPSAPARLPAGRPSETRTRRWHGGRRGVLGGSRRSSRMPASCRRTGLASAKLCFGHLATRSLLRLLTWTLETHHRDSPLRIQIGHYCYHCYYSHPLPRRERCPPIGNGSLPLETCGRTGVGPGLPARPLRLRKLSNTAAGISRWGHQRILHHRYYKDYHIETSGVRARETRHIGGTHSTSMLPDDAHRTATLSKS